jgi:hypothetical protein
MSAPSTTAEYLTWLVHDAGWVELCHMDGARVDPGWDNRPDAILADARGLHRTGNLFTSLHRIDIEALKAYLAEKRQVDPRKQTFRTPDEVVTRYCRLFFDFDPARPKGTSSTSAELETAEERARGLVAKLSAMDWPTPLIAMSGNGWHVQYRSAMPNTPEWAEILRTVYVGLYAELSDDEVSFDRSVRNPARLCALYGSTKRKGINHPERPHRKSMCWIPSDWRQVHPRQVAALADIYARQTPEKVEKQPVERSAISGRGNYASLDVVSWFAAHDAYVGSLGGTVHGVRCPWSAEHSSESPKNGSDTVIFEADDGWPGFHCKHSHCTDRNIRDVMTLWGDADNYCSTAFVARRTANV